MGADCSETITVSIDEASKPGDGWHKDVTVIAEAIQGGVPAVAEEAWGVTISDGSVVEVAAG